VKAFKGAAAVALVLLAVCLMARGQTSAAPHRPAVHVTAKAHH
jgi:hypothetical protein